MMSVSHFSLPNPFPCQVFARINQLFLKLLNTVLKQANYDTNYIKILFRERK